MDDLQQVRSNIILAQLRLAEALDVLDAKDASDEQPERADPRDKNCTYHHVTDGKVDAIFLSVHAFKDSPYRLIHARLIDENEAQGQHVARCRLLDSSGRPKRGRIVLATGYQGNTDHFDQCMGVMYDGGDKPLEHVISAKFSPPNLGPLALFVAGADDFQIGSDVLASIGLPWGHHISIECTFQEV